MTEYTPSAEWAYIRNAYARSQKNETFGSEGETEDALGEALREFDDTLAAHDARVRRDAGRAALDRLDDIDHWDDLWDESGPLAGTIAQRIRTHRDTHYREED